MARIERLPSARPELHPSLKPPDDLLLVDRRGHLLVERVSVKFLVVRAMAVEAGANAVGIVGRAEIGTGHAVEPIVDSARPAAVDVIGGECRAQRAAGIAGRWLDPDALELSLAQDLAIGDAVERDAAGETEVRHAGFGSERAGETQDNLLGDRLDRSGDVHLALADRVFAAARLAAEQLVKPIVGHPQSGAIVEVALIDAESAVGLEVDEMVEDELSVFGFAVRGEAHHLVFTVVDLETEIVGEGRVEQTKRMREMNLPHDLDLVAATEADGGGGPFADPVHGQDHGLVEG